VFERVVCGVESSPESLVAVRQAARLVSPDGRLVLVSVADVALAAQAGWAATSVSDQIVAEAREALATAENEAPGAEGTVVEGAPAASLLSAVRGEDADLVVVGTHTRSRAAGILLGSVATRMLHDAPCSVLVAREAPAASSFPDGICIGVDGSRASALAAETGRELAKRFGSSLTVLVGGGDKEVDAAAVRETEPEAAIDERSAVEALVEGAAEAGVDLLVVGSRGLRGVKSLGSVSERVAHRAGCSVLVVREARR
jgi:nucleotide-binding universal stress UspA family protein